MKLQYQSSNGDWTNCTDGTTYGHYGKISAKGDWQDRTEKFLLLCMENNRISADGKINNRETYATDRTLTRDEAVTALEAGIVLRNDRDDWYSNCRDGEIYDRKMAERRAKAEAAKDWPDGRKLSCGHVIYYKSQVMSASLGSSCSECYDRMSD